MAAELKFFSAQEYLERERQAEYKSEYINGVTYAMSGGTPEHSLIAVNLAAEIHAHLRSSPCQVFNSDLKVGVPSGLKFFYPDLTIICDKPVFADEQKDVLLNPLVLIEVLSESSLANDRGKKFQSYQEIESFKEYWLVTQDEPIVERYVRQPDGNWIYTKFAGLEQSIDLQSIGCRLALKDIYAKVF